MSDTFRNRLMLAVALVLAAIYLFPLYWMYITALKTGSAMFATPPGFCPASRNGASTPMSGRAATWAGISGIRSSSPSAPWR